MRYHLRTLLFGMAVGPPLLAVCYLCWHPPDNFDSFEMLVTALAAIVAGVAATVCFAVFWRKRWGGRPT